MLASSISLTGMGMLALPATIAVAQDSEIGEFDFLDYLGTLVEQDGEWLDPIDMEIDSFTASDDEALTPVSTNDDEPETAAEDTQ